MGTAIQSHVGEKFGLVNLTGVCAGNSDPDGDLVFNQIGQILVRAVTGGRLFIQISVFIGPGDTPIDKKHIRIVPFGMGDFSKLKTSGCCLIVVAA
jgi:hypothetical protein